SPVYGVSAFADGRAIVQFFSPPVLNKSFTPAQISSGGVSILTLTISNTNPRAMTNGSFTDNLGNAGIQVAPSPNLINNCPAGSNVAGASAGNTLLTITGVDLPAQGSPGATCTI